MIPPFETTFAVPLHCQSCVDDVSTSLHKLDGITSIEASIPTQLLSIIGTAPPSSIVAAIESTGRDAILRGSGRADSAAVCILETHASHVTSPVRGLIRLVQVADRMTVADISVQGMTTPGRYGVMVRERGDISLGAASTGEMWEGKREGEGRGRGWFGWLEIGEDGRGAVFVDRPIEIWELIGRSMVVSTKESGFETEDEDTLVGVIARSAGVWDNDKTVCSCSGKTVWEERKEQTSKGML